MTGSRDLQGGVTLTVCIVTARVSLDLMSQLCREKGCYCGACLATRDRIRSFSSVSLSYTELH